MARLTKRNKTKILNEITALEMEILVYTYYPWEATDVAVTYGALLSSFQ
jgi:hypothetical protein